MVYYVLVCSIVVWYIYRGANRIVAHTTGGTRNTAYLFEQQKTKKNPVGDKRRKLTPASNAKKLIYIKTVSCNYSPIIQQKFQKI